MAVITLLTPAQIAARDQKPRGRSGRKRSAERTRLIEDYKTILRAAQPGDGADVLLEPGDDKRVVGRNLKAAALELHLDAACRPVHDASRIDPRFLTPEERVARPKRRGRPRKNVQPAPPSSIRASDPDGNGGSETAQADVALTGALTDGAAPSRRQSNVVV